MAFGLEPLVRGKSARNKALLGIFVTGLVGTAALVGFTLGTIGWSIASHVNRELVLGGLVVVAIFIELEVLQFSAPYRHWQVPRDWPSKYGAAGGYGLWGATLGAGFLSYVPFASYHVLLVWLLLSGGPASGAVIGGLYGAGRVLASLGPAVMAARKPDESKVRAEAALTREQLSRGVQVAMLFGVAASLIVISTGGGQG
jgi:hypothetical protein